MKIIQKFSSKIIQNFFSFFLSGAVFVFILLVRYELV